MRIRPCLSLFSLGIFLGIWIQASAVEQTIEASEGEKLFALKVGPILQEKCLACHSEKEGKLKGDLDLSSRE